MRKIVAVVLSSALLGGAGHAQPAAPAAACKALAGAVDFQLKDLSYTHFAATARSAPQATQLATEQQNKISMIGINIGLMSFHHCPMPTVPISEFAYTLNALECATAELSEATGKGDAAKEVKCDRSKWTPMSSGTKADSKPAG